MKLKLLPVFMLLAGFVSGQDTIRSLVITEAFIGRNYRNHAEITNMGTQPVQLNNFVFGRCQNANYTSGRAVIRLPDRVLQPGESFLLGEFCDWIVDIPETSWNVNLPYHLGTPFEWEELLDMKCHRNENLWGEARSPLDSVTSPQFIGNWWGRSALFIEQQLTDTTSVVVDQVGGVWDNAAGNGNQRSLAYEDSYAVAGFPNATSQARLIRKYSVKTGNLNFADARGVGEDDSEWFAIPFIFSPARMQPWTLGSHGNFNLDANTLEPLIDGMVVDFANKKITVPWGLRKPDGIMANMKKKGGIAWYYHMNSNPEDSLSFAVCTGDKLEVLVAGVDLDRAIFDIVVSDPTPSDNIVIPRFKMNFELGGRAGIEFMEPIRDNWSLWPIVTANESGMDTIRGRKVQRYPLIPNPDVYFGIPYATRVDTLLKLLEKPDNAEWEIVWVDGVKRPDLKKGDILKVTSKNGSVKEYYLLVDKYQPSSNARLDAITWPDIPNFYRGLMGWKGDTVPHFAFYTLGYQVKVPVDIQGIPALVAKPVTNNTKVELKRATNLFGSLEDRTTSFEVTAENNTTVNTYNVILIKEQLPGNEEPYHAEPFLSKIAVNEQFGNSFMEICNPGNQVLDLSNYMMVENYANPNPSAAITKLMLPADWQNRFAKYVPGYKWVDEATWAQTPGILVPDLGVNPLVMPGDVFVMAEIQRDEVLWRIDPKYDWPILKEMDVQFRQPAALNWLQPYYNPWGENVNAVPMPQWGASNWFLFKILNDSVKRGLKPANDPEDFQLIETFGMANGANWAFSDPAAQNTNFNCSAWGRLPQYAKPNPIMGASFGTEFDPCEWISKGGESGQYWNIVVGIPTPLHQASTSNDFGYHFFIPESDFKSTIGSNKYKVSNGYGRGEQISGIITGTTAADFLANIIKLNEGQTLKVNNIAGTPVAMDAALTLGDTLVVLSADSTNTTWYALKVAATGLSSNAVLTSNLFDITIVEEPKSGGEETAGVATIKGFQIGSTLQFIYNNVVVPPGATLTVVDGFGNYVPFKRVNFNKEYVIVTVNDNTYFEVIAEDMATKIVYQLLPTSSSDDAFVTSDLLRVSQSEMLIEYVPAGEFAAGGAVTVNNFLNMLIPSVGATIKLVDKSGLERMDGAVVEDDKVVVTSPSGNVTRVYHLSFMPNPMVPQSLYLAYVLSNEYMVDQVSYVISGPSGLTLLSEFYSKITASRGATAVVVDLEGNERTSGDLNDGDMLKVTSADGKIVVMYELDLDLTSTNILNTTQIRLYPNPTAGTISIAGVNPGDRIQVFNAAGAAIRNLNVISNIETLSVDGPAGLYLIVISDKNQMLGRYKVLKK